MPKFPPQTKDSRQIWQIRQCDDSDVGSRRSKNRNDPFAERLIKDLQFAYTFPRSTMFAFAVVLTKSAE